MSFNISSLASSIDASGIRKVFELRESLSNPIDLSIGQPDFLVPEILKEGAINAIKKNINGYTLTQGSARLIEKIDSHLENEFDQKFLDNNRTMVTSGTSGGIFLAFLSILNPGDEIIIPDPWFVIYPALAKIAGAIPVPCNLYPDFRMTANRIKPLITEKTKAILVNSPANPSGVVLKEDELHEIVELCRSKNIILITDEIYDLFYYEGDRLPTPASYSNLDGAEIVLIRGFGKTYGCTGWRVGYAAGPENIIEAMIKLQQFSFVCAPSVAQEALANFSECDMSKNIKIYRSRRDRVIQKLSTISDLVIPEGAFYAFIPLKNETGKDFAKRAFEKSVLVVPGGEFSSRDTHFRISFAVNDGILDRGLDIIKALLVGNK